MMIRIQSLLRVLVVVLVAVPAAAQAPEETNVDEVAAYQAWYLANAAGEAAKATEAARAYIEKFPQGEHAEYLGKWLAGAQWGAFNEAIKKKDMAEMVRLGEARLQQDPKDLAYLYWMSLNLRQNELLTSAAAAHHAQAGDFSRRAIDLIAAGGVPAGADPAKWDKDANLAWLHQNLGLVAAKTGQTEAALAAYEASSALAPQDVAIQARNSLGCGSLHKDLYDKAVAAYQALPDAEPAADAPSAAVKEAVDTANRHADAAIECWARFLGVMGTSGSAELRSRIESTLSALYQYRHPDAPEGYKALVEKYALTR